MAAGAPKEVLDVGFGSLACSPLELVSAQAGEQPGSNLVQSAALRGGAGAPGVKKQPAGRLQRRCLAFSVADRPVVRECLLDQFPRRAGSAALMEDGAEDVQREAECG